MILLLWQHPAASQCATDEVRSVIGITDAPTLEQLAALDHVETCAFETMRMKPLAPIMGVQALA